MANPVANIEDLLSEAPGYVPGAGSRSTYQGLQFLSPVLHPTNTQSATTGTVSYDPTQGTLWKLTPTGAMTINGKSAPSGQDLYLVVTTAGTSSFVLTFNTNFKSTGTLTTGTVSGKVFVLHFHGDGTNFNEVSRTVAM